MNRTARFAARLITATLFAGGALVTATATGASAGGCDAFDPSCNQTGGEWCQDVAMVDPATGDIIGYRNICEDLTIDWNEQTPDCPCNQTREPGKTVLVAPEAPRPTRVR